MHDVQGSSSPLSHGTTQTVSVQVIKKDKGEPLYLLYPYLFSIYNFRDGHWLTGTVVRGLRDGFIGPEGFHRGPRSPRSEAILKVQQKTSSYL